MTGGEQLWAPTPEQRSVSRLARYLDTLVAAGHISAPDYDQAWAWSVRDLDGFWSSIGAWAEVPWAVPPRRYFDGDPGAGAGPLPASAWCPDGLVNYAQCAVANAPKVAVLARSQTRGPSELRGADLAQLVARARVGLRRAGVAAGDRVAGYLPNIPEALIAFLAAASMGAVWTDCAPEMGVRGVIDRLGQVNPTVLIAVDGYRYGARAVDRSAEVRRIAASLPTLTRTVVVPYLAPNPALEKGWWTWDELISVDETGLAGPGDEGVVPVAFAHPLYILFSSGTTGVPKAIVHSHGAMLLEHSKALSLHHDLGPGDRFFWYTTTGWMMWNFLVSGLLVGATVVLFDGDPTWPRPGALWDHVGETGSTFAGMGAGYLVGGERAGLVPAHHADLSALRGVGSTGSPLPATAARWVYAAIGTDIALASISGGTDVCTAFVGWSPLHPVWAGEISCRWLGADVAVFDDAGHEVVGQEGELVVRAPMPSMPVGFWGDDGDERYRRSYFTRFPGAWAHGDRMTLTDRGTCVITGRSDGTLNRGGVRMGTAEFYAVVEELPDVTDSLVVHVEDPGGGPGTLWLFVVVAGGADISRDLEERLRRSLREAMSPRHVPDRIVAVAGVPRTLSGKKLEVPVKRLLSGAALDGVLSVDAVANPEVLEEYTRLV